ncbi:MAG: response regulator transcription factor [Kiritimatiellales bacterium]|nr:response regulator transcription factor [Kiritimatiellales bacterium]
MNKIFTVAVVDDDRGTRELLADRIGEESDFRCVNIYADPLAAIAGLPADHPDIVLMDVNMPGMTGIECVRQLKPIMPNTDFVMLTVYDDTHYIFEALAAGAVGYLLKRSAGEKLIQALRDATQGGSPMDSDIARKVVQSFQTPPQKESEELEALSDRERQVLDQLAQGRLYKEISEELDISIHTVHTYIRRIYEKLHVHSRSEAVAKLSGL